MDMITSRNLTSHTYNDELAHEIIKKIVNEYFSEFKKMIEQFETLKCKYEK
jgi:hypothetical protein